MDAEVSTHTFCLFHVVWTIFWGVQLFLYGTHGIYFYLHPTTWNRQNVCVLTSASMIVYLFVMRSWSAIIWTKQPKINQSPQQQLFLYGTHGIYFYLHPTFFSSTEPWAWAIISPKEFKSWVTCISFALLYGKTELSAVKPWLFIFSSWGHDRQSSEQNNRKLISLHNNGEDDKHAHGFADF
jgi:hypothetical protein